MKRINTNYQDSKSLLANRIKFESINAKINKNKSYNLRSFIFMDQVLTKKELEELLAWMFRNYGIRKTCMLAELLKEAGFNYATQGGISLNLEDLKVPRSKSLLVNSTNKDLTQGETLYKRGELTTSEWFQKQVMAWNLTSELLKSEIIEFFEKTDPLNPLYMMSFSGARGNMSQVRQLIGMRGLMSDQKGEMIGSAIQKNFREGLSVIDFLISSYGARKGLVDTAIRTADSGYMTRRLIDIAQDVIVRQFDCQSTSGIIITLLKPYSDIKIKKSLDDRLVGRILAKPILHPKTKQLLAHRGQEIDLNLAKLIHSFSISVVNVRSPLTCESYRSVCQACFGWDLTQHRLIEIGEAIGIIAAQSIGEPGTQLTMRTFHTGGVFSREIEQQIRSGYSGQIQFAPNLKTQFLRTNQGDYGQVIRNTSFFEIKTYKNEVIRIKVDRGDLLIIKDKQFIKKGQPIVQSSSTLDESDTEIQKTLSTKFAGEIYYQPRKNYNFFEYNMIIWVLAGNLITLPYESKKFIRSINQTQKVFGRTKYVIKSNPFTQRIRILAENNVALISRFVDLEKIRILKYKAPYFKANQVNLLEFKNNEKLILRKDLLPSNNTNNFDGYLGRFLKKNYLLKTGGTLHFLSAEKNSPNITKPKNLNWIELTQGAIVVWLPEEIYKYIPLNYIHKLSEGKLIKKSQLIGPKTYSCVQGLVKYKKCNRRLNDVSIQYGTIITIKKSLLNINKLNKLLNNKFLFPGENLFGRICINKIVFIELLVNTDTIQILLRPVSIYTIPKPRIYRAIGQNLPTLNEDLLVQSRQFLTFKLNESITSKHRSLLEIGLFAINSNNLVNQKSEIVLNFCSKKKNHWFLEFGRSHNISQPIIRSRRLKLQNLSTFPYVKASQILEPYTVLGCLEVLNDDNNKVIESKSKYSSRYQSQELLVINNQHLRTLYFDETQKSMLKKDFILAGDLVHSGTLVTIGGKITNVRGCKLDFQIGSPYLFTEGAKVYKNHLDFAPANTVLGFVTYKIFKTQDIIQGLPKVEEILEARGSSDPALLAEKAGIVSEILSHDRSRSSQIEVLSHIKQFRTIREVPYILEEIEKDSIEIENYQFINLTDKFHKGVSDPQQILDIYFEYFKQRDAHHKAVLRSLYRIASMFVKAIQGVYESQGIKIVDRHLEVIVRQMILKAKIEYPGSTPLVYGEYVDVQQLLILNQMLANKNKKLVYYKPTLLGLTKAALTTESFISAASFQETVRILTQAAIEGRVDWLRGLKEKVIVGGLIPSGTGILTFLDEWVSKNVFLLGRTTISAKSRRKILRKRLKRENFSYSSTHTIKDNFDSFEKNQVFLGKSTNKLTKKK